MFMNNKVFLDSSILIEALKGNKKKFYHGLVSDADYLLYINSTVISEYLYYLIGFSGGSSPRSLQQSNKLKNVLLDEENQTKILTDFQFIEAGKSALTLVPQFMSQYNLLPNDAIILATCKIHNITKLASHDADFIVPCQQEGIQLLTETE